MPAMPMALSMKPTGWFQVAWSADVAVGDVKPIHYLGRDLIVYRTEDGAAHVMDAYCEHLGAHFGYGGSVRGELLICPFHGWEWDTVGRNVCIPYQERPNNARRIRTWPTRELNESIFLWHDLAGRDPLYEVPDVFTMFGDGASSADYYSAHPKSAMLRERLSLHPQFVIENGVDYAHFKFVHRAAEVPTFTRQEFDDWCFYADFEMKFRPSRSSAAAGATEEMVGGVHAVNYGISLGYSLSWGGDRTRLQVSVTPVDEYTSDIRSTVWLERAQGDDQPQPPESMDRRIRIANNQFLADVRIWEHQRYTEPPGLATAEAAGFRAVRRWARRFYPEGERGHGAAEQDAAIE
jgi:3-ketosteroid 9alpha-monooxygenase subunit A